MWQSFTITEKSLRYLRTIRLPCHRYLHYYPQRVLSYYTYHHYLPSWSLKGNKRFFASKFVNSSTSTFNSTSDFDHVNPECEDDEIQEIENLHPALLKKADSLMQELNDLESRMSQNSNDFSLEDNKKLAHLSSFSAIYSNFKKLSENFKELNDIIENVDNENDSLLIDEAKIEIKEILPQLISAINDLKSSLLPRHEFANNSTILELRPGAGGHEANIFANDLLNMYIKYCQFHNWKFEILSKTDHISGSGIVDATLSINHNGSYDRLRHEIGVHRVQRVPQTETKGRVHTSAAGVIVLPKIDDDNSNSNSIRKFKPDELKIDVMRASGAGGQHVNTTESAVRITHLPTGIVVSIQDERSQHKNKDKALTVLRARLAELEMREKREKEREARTGQVSSVDRSDKIRTYNFQQNRVTDHRCGYTLHDLDGCMNGTKLDLVIDHVAKKEADDAALDLIKQLETNNC
ncbi:hypothetical protein CANINC_001723 [Pichia inconspicua]|uniref:Peptide chain release factor 1, mitochondrial n=1 Tax=Pichia inconspicua TaxID=52247 RepID=A0A4V4NFX0_9ASCO|nr:hypothetical protein CANINC_001723 [[Candida] inconspicua]